MLRRISYDKPCSDHLGNNFGSIKAICIFWNINPETYSRRIVYKMTLEEALTKPVKANGGKNIRTIADKSFTVKHPCVGTGALNEKFTNIEFRMVGKLKLH